MSERPRWNERLRREVADELEDATFWLATAPWARTMRAVTSRDELRKM